MKLLPVFGRAVACFCVLAVLLALAGHHAVRAATPLYARVIRTVQPFNGLPALRVERDAISLIVAARKPVTLPDGQRVVMRRDISVALATPTAYLQTLVALAILLAWPATWRKRMTAILLLLPLLVALSAADIPLVLAWEVEDAAAADFPGSVRTVHLDGVDIQTRVNDRPGLTYWTVFLNSGGRVLLAILAAGAAWQLAPTPRRPARSAAGER